MGRNMRETSLSNQDFTNRGDPDSSQLTGTTMVSQKSDVDKGKDKKKNMMAAAYGVKRDDKTRKSRGMKRASSRQSVRSSHSVKTPMVSRKGRFES